MSQRKSSPAKTLAARANEDPEDMRPPKQDIFYQILLRRETPLSGAEADQLLQTCLCRSQSLAAILTEYAWGDNGSWEELRFVLELLDDMLAMAYSCSTERHEEAHP